MKQLKQSSLFLMFNLYIQVMILINIQE